MPAVRYLSAIDVGTATTRAVIAAVDEARDRLTLAGWGQAANRGLSHGIVVDIQAAQVGLREAVRAAEAMAQRRMERAYVSLSGAHVQTVVTPAILSVNRSQRISGATMQQALQQARQFQLKPNQQIIHTLAGPWTVDDQFHVQRPEGMHAARLGVEALIISGNSTAIGNLLHCLAAIHVDVEELVLSPLASSQTALTSEEKQMGAVLIDMGAGATDVIAYQGGHVQLIQSLATGGGQFSHDLATQMHCPLPVAERLKRDHGAAQPAAAGRAEVKAQVFGDQGEVAFSTRFLARILAARAETLWAQVEAALGQVDLGALPAGIVLTGGASQLARLNESCRAHFQVPVRVASVPYTLPLHQFASEQRAPAYATVIGLLLWGRQAEAQVLSAPAPRPTPATGWRRTVRAVLAHFLPG